MRNETWLIQSIISFDKCRVSFLNPAYALEILRLNFLNNFEPTWRPVHIKLTSINIFNYPDLYLFPLVVDILSACLLSFLQHHFYIVEPPAAKSFLENRVRIRNRITLSQPLASSKAAPNAWEQLAAAITVPFSKCFCLKSSIPIKISETPKCPYRSPVRAKLPASTPIELIIESTSFGDV